MKVPCVVTTHASRSVWEISDLGSAYCSMQFVRVEHMYVWVQHSSTMLRSMIAVIGGHID